MRYRLIIILFFFFLFTHPKTQAQFFNQDFNISATAGDYTSSMSPNIRQFNGFNVTSSATITTTSNTLNLTRGASGGATASVVRSTDISGIGSGANAYMVRFSITGLSGTSAGNAVAARFQFGTTFNNTTAGEPASQTFAEFYMHNSSTANQFRTSIDGTTTSASFAPTQRITFVMNKSGSGITYRNPSNTTTTLASGNVDLWVGTTQVITNTAIPSGSATVITNFKLIFSPNINTTLSIDDISMFPLPTFPTNTYTVGTAGTVAAATSTFTSITRNGGGFFEVLNFTNNINGANTFSVNSNITNEDGTNDLKQLNGMSAANVVSIIPNTSTERIVSGNVNPGAGEGGMIQLNGADYVIIDGNIAGTRYLRFRNTNTGGGTRNATFLMVNGATNNSIQNCFIEGGATGTSGTNGGVIRITGTNSVGNSSIQITNNHIRNLSTMGAGLAGTSVMIQGSASPNQNDNILIQNNDIYNFFIDAQGNQNTFTVQGNTTNITIRENHFYQTVNYNASSSSTRAVLLRVEGTGNNNVFIKKNFFGGRQRNCGGSYMIYNMGTADQPITFRGAIRINNFADNPLVEIDSNTISNIHTIVRKNANCNEVGMSMIQAEAGTVKIRYNTIGSTTNNTALRITQESTRTGFCNGGANACDEFMGVRFINYTARGSGSIENNRMGGLTCQINQSQNFSNFEVVGMRIQNSTAGLVVKNNLIGSPNSTDNVRIIHDIGTSGSINTMRGIQILSTAANTVIIENDTIANITNYSENTVTPNLMTCAANNGVTIRSFTHAIEQTGASNANIVNNLIYNIQGYGQVSNNLDVATVAGIVINATPTNITIQSNKIYSIRSLATTNTTAAGMLLTGGLNGRAFNNQIYDITNNVATTTAPIAAGIVVRNVGSSGTYTGFHTYNNRISLGLQPVAGTGTSNPDQTLFIGIYNNFSDTDKLYLFFNSVNIGGTASGGGYKTFGFFRGNNPESTPDASLVTTPLQVYNNIFQNSRTGGSGTHYAIGIQDITAPDQAPCPAATNEYAPDYNVYYASDATRLGEAGGTAVNFATWQTSFSPNIDIHSYDASPSTVPIAFIDVGIADMHLTVNDQRPDGRALPIATELGFPLTIDFDIDNEFRRSTDTGADELEQTITFVGNTPSDNWHDPNNWLVLGSMPERNVVPNCADNVIVPSGKTIRVYNGGTENPTNEPALFYTLTIQNGATLELQNGTVMNSCWYNDELTVNQVHKGEFKNEAGGVFIANTGTLNIAGRFTDNGTFQKGLGTVVMNRDRPPLGLECLEKYIHARNDDSKVSNIAGTSNTNFHNLTIYTNETLASNNMTKDDNFSGNTTIVGTHDIFVGDATSDLGTLDIQGVMLGTGGWIATNGNKLTLEGDLSENNGTITGSTTSKLSILGRGTLTGTLKFTDVDSDGFEDFQEVVMNRPSSGLAILGNKSLRINSFLDLTEGRLKTGAVETTYEANVTNANAATSVINYETAGYTGKGWVWGQLRRAVAGIASYKYPIGDASRYELIDIDIAFGLGTTANILGYFNPNNAPGSVNLTEGGITYDNLCVNGYWQMTPNAQPSSGNFNINLFPVGIACSGAPINFAKSPTGAGTYSFGGSSPLTTIRRTGFTNFSDITLISPVVVLPVELIYFNALAQENSALITWETVWERNNAYFEVEKSIDGKNFFVIGKIEGRGTANEKNLYQLTDNEPNKGINYYRLRQVDFDGKINYSKIVSLLFENGEDIFEVYPNPAKDLDITISMTAKAGNLLNIKVIDMLGRNIFIENLNYQNRFIKLKSAEKLASGVYFIIVQNITTGELKRKKLVIE
jgi:hypothetical protein